MHRLSMQTFRAMFAALRSMSVKIVDRSSSKNKTRLKYSSLCTHGGGSGRGGGGGGLFFSCPFSTGMCDGERIWLFSRARAGAASDEPASADRFDINARIVSRGCDAGIDVVGVDKMAARSRLPSRPFFFSGCLTPFFKKKEASVSWRILHV